MSIVPIAWEDDGECLIPDDVVTMLEKVPAKAVKEARLLEITREGDTVTGRFVHRAGEITATDMVTGSFPRWEQLVPVEKDYSLPGGFTLGLCPAYLARLAAIVKALGGNPAESGQCAVIVHAVENKPVVWTLNGAHLAGGPVRFVQMPVRIP